MNGKVVRSTTAGSGASQSFLHYLIASSVVVQCVHAFLSGQSQGFPELPESFKQLFMPLMSTTAVPYNCIIDRQCLLILQRAQRAFQNMHFHKVYACVTGQSQFSKSDPSEQGLGSPADSEPSLSPQMSPETILLLLLTAGAMFGEVCECFPNGSLALSCGDMMPFHPPFSPSTNPPPFTLSTSSATFRPGGIITGRFSLYQLCCSMIF